MIRNRTHAHHGSTALTHATRPRRSAAFGDVFLKGFLFAQDVVVVLSEAVGFVAHGLKQPKGFVVAREAYWSGPGLDIDFFLALGQ